MDAVHARPGQALSEISATSVLRLLERGGALLFRGFDCSHLEFERFSSQLCSRFHLPAVRHPAYVDRAPYARADNGVFFGDGEALSDEIINTLIDIQDEVAVNHRLQGGDLLVLDNSRVMHGRRATVEDCPRRLLARFGYLQDS